MVGQFTALFSKESMTFAQRFNHVVKVGDADTAYFCQFFYVDTEVSRYFYGHCLVRTPGRQHLDFKTAFTGSDVIFQ